MTLLFSHLIKPFYVVFDPYHAFLHPQYCVGSESLEAADDEVIDGSCPRAEILVSIKIPRAIELVLGWNVPHELLVVIQEESEVLDELSALVRDYFCLYGS